ncbi:hypothetical protein GQ44DRAFT_699795 [Phaeosphaeriaceae sp. PMI808]|nr:hypothetical protein GQ44DRAFT_699795 [Phaeosphaeriaceae sp. PMI808]
MTDFNNTWGPVWVTHTKDKTDKLGTASVKVIRYNVGLGWIVPWQRTTDEPIALLNEVFAHWTDDVTDLLDSKPFPESDPNMRFLIGGSLRLSVNNHCTLPDENARRRPLTKILGSSIMRNYLESLQFDWEHPESMTLYLEAMANKNIRAFEDLYFHRPDLQKDLGHAAAICLHALRHTGTRNGISLDALWCPSRREKWTTTFSYWDRHWLGILKDTTMSCTFAILSPNCLVMKDHPDIRMSRCQHPQSNALTTISSDMQQTTHSYYDGHISALETTIIINDAAALPCGLHHDGERWKMSHCEPGVELDLGESGRLEYLGRMLPSRRRRSKGAFVRWLSPPVLREGLQQMKELISLPRSPCHRELVVYEANHGIKTLPVYIVANWR